MREYVFSSEAAGRFLERLEPLLAFLLPQYRQEGRTELVIAVGCTGGHHRSVAVAHALTEFIRQKGYRVEETHRDISPSGYFTVRGRRTDAVICVQGEK